MQTPHMFTIVWSSAATVAVMIDVRRAGAPCLNDVTLSGVSISSWTMRMMILWRLKRVSGIVE